MLSTAPFGSNFRSLQVIFLFLCATLINFQTLNINGITETDSMVSAVYCIKKYYSHSHYSHVVMLEWEI